jgi:HEAT repeat protein
VRRTGLAVILHGPLDEHVSLELDQAPLRESLHKILRDEIFALYETWTDLTLDNASRPMTLWVFPEGSVGHPEFPGKLLYSSSEAGSGINVEVLKSDVIDMNARVRLRAVKGLRKAEAITPLSVALVDEDENIRVQTIYAMADIGGDQAAAALTVALADGNAWVRQEAAYALASIGGETAIQSLKQILRDSDREIKETAIEAYTDIGGAESAWALAMVLDDPDTSLRMQAVEALGEIGGDSAIQILRNAIGDGESEVREAVVEALIEIGGDDAVRLLANSLNDENIDRQQVVDALAKIGGEAASHALQLAKKGNDSSVP